MKVAGLIGFVLLVCMLPISFAQFTFEPNSLILHGGGNEMFTPDYETTVDQWDINSSGVYLTNVSWLETFAQAELTCSDGNIFIDEDEVEQATSDFRTLYDYDCIGYNKTLQYATISTIQNGQSMYFDYSLFVSFVNISEDRIYFEGMSWTLLDGTSCVATTFSHTVDGQFVTLRDLPSSVAIFNATGFNCAGGSSGGGGGSGGGTTDDDETPVINENSSGGGVSSGYVSQTTELGGVEVIQPASQEIRQPFCKINTQIEFPMTIFNPHPTNASYEFEFDNVECEEIENVHVGGKETAIVTLSCACPKVEGEIIEGNILIYDDRDPLAYAKIPVKLTGSTLNGFSLAILVVVVALFLAGLIGLFITVVNRK